MTDVYVVLRIFFALVFFYFIVRTYRIYIHTKTKYNLTLFVVFLLLFTSNCVGIVYPEYLQITDTKVRITILVIFGMGLITFLFYPNIQKSSFMRKIREKKRKKE